MSRLHLSALVVCAALMGACSSSSSAETEPATRSAPATSPRTGAAAIGHGHGAHDHAAAAADPAAHEDHTPRHGGQLGMQGDVHIELVSRPDGRHQVFLSDALRVPIAMDRVRNARLRHLPAAGAEVESPLAPDATIGALVATRALPASGGELSVRLEVGSERITMDFALAAATDPHAGHAH
ncbi:MAG: hypothetical protein IT379_30960 [Deltaproteobacteria bacterium]|nr:hypothetical protein [Deltaproteobacteria bacterium]